MVPHIHAISNRLVDKCVKIKGRGSGAKTSTLFARIGKYDISIPSSESLYSISTTNYIDDDLFSMGSAVDFWTTTTKPSCVDICGNTVFTLNSTQTKSPDVKSRDDILMTKFVGDHHQHNNNDGARSRYRVVTRDDLEKLYAIPLASAAKVLSISPTMLKRTCRRLGVNHWPHRQLAPVQKRLDYLTKRVEQPYLYALNFAQVNVMETELLKLLQDSKYIISCANNGMRAVLCERIGKKHRRKIMYCVPRRKN